MREIIKVSLGHEINYQGRLVRRETVKVGLVTKEIVKIGLVIREILKVGLIMREIVR
jgi:hypothetical protein